MLSSDQVYKRLRTDLRSLPVPSFKRMKYDKFYTPIDLKVYDPGEFRFSTRPYKPTAPIMISVPGVSGQDKTSKLLNKFSKAYPDQPYHAPTLPPFVKLPLPNRINPSEKIFNDKTRVKHWNQYYDADQMQWVPDFIDNEGNVNPNVSQRDLDETIRRVVNSDDKKDDKNDEDDDDDSDGGGGGGGGDGDGEKDPPVITESSDDSDEEKELEKTIEEFITERAAKLQETEKEEAAKTKAIVDLWPSDEDEPPSEESQKLILENIDKFMGDTTASDNAAASLQLAARDKSDLKRSGSERISLPEAIDIFLEGQPLAEKVEAIRRIEAQDRKDSTPSVGDWGDPMPLTGEYDKRWDPSYVPVVPVDKFETPPEGSNLPPSLPFDSKNLRSDLGPPLQSRGVARTNNPYMITMQSPAQPTVLNFNGDTPHVNHLHPSSSLNASTRSPTRKTPFKSQYKHSTKTPPKSSKKIQSSQSSPSKTRSKTSKGSLVDYRYRDKDFRKKELEKLQKRLALEARKNVEERRKRQPALRSPPKAVIKPLGSR